MRGTIKDGDRFNYVTKTSMGKTLKSSTTYLTNDEGQTLGALCVNLDITNYVPFYHSLTSLIGDDVITSSDTTAESIEFHANDVSQLTDFLLAKGMEQVNKSVEEMTREDKMKVIQYLDKKGAFLITKSGEKVCQFLDISKFTLYNYLDAVRADNGSDFPTHIRSLIIFSNDSSNIRSSS